MGSLRSTRKKRKKNKKERGGGEGGGVLEGNGAAELRKNFLDTESGKGRGESNKWLTRWERSFGSLKNRQCICGNTNAKGHKRKTIVKKTSEKGEKREGKKRTFDEIKRKKVLSHQTKTQEGT